MVLLETHAHDSRQISTALTQVRSDPPRLPPAPERQLRREVARQVDDEVGRTAGEGIERPITAQTDDEGVRDDVVGVVVEVGDQRLRSVAGIERDVARPGDEVDDRGVADDSLGCRGDRRALTTAARLLIRGHPTRERRAGVGAGGGFTWSGVEPPHGVGQRMVIEAARSRWGIVARDIHDEVRRSVGEDIKLPITAQANANGVRDDVVGVVVEVGDQGLRGVARIEGDVARPGDEVDDGGVADNGLGVGRDGDALASPARQERERGAASDRRAGVIASRSLARSGIEQADWTRKRIVLQDEDWYRYIRLYDG